ncbi:hypothetical protein LOTGIDRAFT_165083 [Lottia gigantea]|uniref:Uncharacterized protein n=1 Tax=Lottia gigantea TaxID=225164 RepID=V4A3H5_LOTGI|nr:hypothetical protein LOTGIDRAFT_165083 [Lottia gigantea]ESO89490.1 hypothetical protein LOTGIDRAFT_165083 [Lottia gigantea]
MDALESLSTLRASDLTTENEYHIYEEIPEYGMGIPTPIAEDIATDCPVCRYSPQDDIPCVCQDSKVARSNPKTSSSNARQSLSLEVSSKKGFQNGNRKYNHANRPLPEIPIELSTTSCNKSNFRNSADLCSRNSNSLSSLDLEIDDEISSLDNLYMNVPENFGRNMTTIDSGKPPLPRVALGVTLRKSQGETEEDFERRTQKLNEFRDYKRRNFPQENLVLPEKPLLTNSYHQRRQSRPKTILTNGSLRSCVALMDAATATKIMPVPSGVTGKDTDASESIVGRSVTGASTSTTTAASTSPALSFEQEDKELQKKLEER